MNDHVTANVSQLPFTGWESDRFVRFAQKLLGMGLSPSVQVVGNEPITSVDVNFEGRVVNTIWDGYRRILIVETKDGITYNVGGTNSTRPIAAQTVLFKDLPTNIVSGEYANVTLDDLLSVLVVSDAITAREIAELIKYNLRLEVFSLEAKGKIVRSLIPFLTGIDSVLKREIVEIFGLDATPDVLEPLLLLFKDQDPDVRADVALRFRGLEHVIKDIRETSELGVRCIDALIDALTDPSDEVRIYSAEDLGYVYNQAAIEALAQSLRFDKNEHVRWAAVIALGRTNEPDAPDIASFLIEALESDPNPFVQQGAILGLARVAGKGIVQRPAAINSLITLLCNKLEGGPPEVRDYAAFAIGALGEVGISCLPALIDAIAPQKPFELKSNASMSLSRLSRYFIEDTHAIAQIEGYLRANLQLPRVSGYPSSAFYNWYLEYAAELASLLDLYELASIYYQEASNAFVGTPWRYKYYQAISLYERVEYLCTIGYLEEALQTSYRALSLLSEVGQLSDFTVQSDRTQSGLQFRLIIAEARRNILKASLLWDIAYEVEEYDEIAGLFSNAARLYRRINIADVASEERRLSREEIFLVSSLRSVALIGERLAKLWVLARSMEGVSIREAIGNLRADIKHLTISASKSRSRALKQTSVKLMDLAEVAQNQLGENIATSEVALDFVNHAKEAFQMALSRPAVECPIISFGSAVMSVHLEGSLSGDGTEDNPFLFPSTERMVLQFDIFVNRRTKNDKLFFRTINPPTGVKEKVEEISVREGGYKIKGVDYGIVSPSRVATEYDFVLEFQNLGCAQLAFELPVWVRIYDPARELKTRTDIQRTQIVSLQAQLKLLKSHLDQLQNIPLLPGSSLPLPTMHDIRTTSSRIKQIETQLSLLGENIEKSSE